MTRLCENDRVEAIQAGAERRLSFLYVVHHTLVTSFASHGIEGALWGGAILTERPGA